MATKAVNESIIIKAISELPQAQNVNNQDLFVLEQSGIAKKLTAETFITEQGIIDALAEALDGHGGIQSVTLSSVSGRIRTYLITFTDETTTTFQVLDGTSIDRIVKTSTAGLTDTYTVFMTDGTTTFFTVTNGADGTVSEAMLNDALKDKAPAITETTESSAIANFTDGADNMVMHNVVVEINPVQDLSNGDPSPTNICPISGWTGCNVTRTGKNLLPNLKAQDTSTRVRLGESVVGNGVWFKAGTYRISYAFKDGTTPTIPFWRTYKNGVHGSVHNAWIITLTEDTNVKVWLFNSSGVSVDNVDWAMVELGSSATAYEPYITPATASISWQTEAGTVYGGTIDVATGLLTVDRASVIIDSARITKDSATRFHVVKTYIGNFSSNGTAIMNKFRKKESTDSYSASGTFFLDTNNLQMNAYRSFDTRDEFVDEYGELQICFTLATPQTYQLTPQQLLTLLGTNNVWADTGNVSVTYPADTKMFIEKLTMPTEDDMTADHAISSGTFFMLGNNLYLATAAIASGATIIEGTNATRLSLADALNRLS